MNHTTTGVIWKGFNVSKTFQRTILLCFSFFGTPFVVPKVCISSLEQNHVPPTCCHFFYKKNINY